MSELNFLHSGGNKVTLTTPTSNPASNITFKLPQADGSAGDLLKTDGSGALSFGTPFSNKNLIINGAMEVAQRGTTSTEQLYQTVDRMRAARTNVDEAPTQSQVDVASGTTPYTLGFRKAFGYVNGNQTSGAEAADTITVSTRIEARDIRTSGWDYVNSNSFITLQFWVKSSVAQTFYFRLRTQDGTSQVYVTSYALSADTWTKVIKTIPGNSNLQFDDDANQGLQIQWHQYMGANYTDNGVSLNTWGAYGAATQAPDQTSTWYTTNDATWQITGVQLEVGDTATSFEHRSFGDELARCQRYYCKSYNYGTAPGTDTMVGSIWGRNYDPTDSRSANVAVVNFPVTMRDTPTVTFRGIHSGTAGNWTTGANNPDASNTDMSVTSLYDLGNNGWTSMSTGNVAASNFFGGHYEAESEI